MSDSAALERPLATRTMTTLMMTVMTTFALSPAGPSLLLELVVLSALVSV